MEESGKYQCQNCGSRYIDEEKSRCLNCEHNVLYVLGQPRYLIVLEHKKTKEQFLHSPFQSNIIAPEGYRKVTSTLPLNEGKYGHLPYLPYKEWAK